MLEGFQVMTVCGVLGFVCVCVWGGSIAGNVAAQDILLCDTKGKEHPPSPMKGSNWTDGCVGERPPVHLRHQASLYGVYNRWVAHIALISRNGE